LDVLKAAQIVWEEGIGFPILLGNKEIILELKEEIGFDADVPIIDPKIKEEEARRNKFANWSSDKDVEFPFGCSKLMRETILQQ
jgi:malate dehydrogenase (oxaloacetate-decarboxylating)(NADP+)